MAINKTRFGQIDGLHSGIKFRAAGDRARQVSFEPFCPAADVDQLHRWVLLQCLVDIRKLLVRYARKFEALFPPRRLVCDYRPDDEPKAHPGQSNVGFLNVGNRPPTNTILFLGVIRNAAQLAKRPARVICTARRI